MRCMQGVLFLFFLSVGATLSAFAQPAESPLQPGEVGLFFDATGTRNVDNVALFATFDVYLVARAPVDGIDAYDLVDLQFPGGALIPMSAPVLPAASAFVLQVLADACSYATAVLPAECPAPAGAVVPLVRYSMMRVGGPEQLCLESFQCPTIAGPVAVDARYRSCVDPGADRFFTAGDHLCVSFDGTVATGRESWTTAKAWFIPRE